MSRTLEMRSSFVPISTMIETAGTVIENNGFALDLIARNIDKGSYSTIGDIREHLQEKINDLKSALAQLENADANLKMMGERNSA